MGIGNEYLNEMQVSSVDIVARLGMSGKLKADATSSIKQ
jgi:hypothetical protein